MDGSFITGIADLVSLPLAVILIGGMGWALLHHLRDCSNNRKEQRQSTDAMRKETHQGLDALRRDMDRRLDEIAKGVAENREAVARIEGRLDRD